MEKGIESLKAEVMRWCAEGENCFNENGCDHQFTRMVPEENPRLIEMGITQSCRRVSKCFHKYCDKYKWVIDRAAHYAEKTGISPEEIINQWENKRTYSFMNFYQECNQPLLDSDNILPYDKWVEKLVDAFGKDTSDWAFKCPKCGNIQNVRDFQKLEVADAKNAVLFECIGRYTTDKGCDWTLGGLFKIHTQSILKDGVVYPVFEMALPNV